MTIGDSFDLQKAINNQNYAFKCWFNYEKSGNTMCITDKDMDIVLDTWKQYFANWKFNAERDVTEYSIEGDYEWNSALDEGKEEAKEVAVNDKTKWDGNTKKSNDIRTANSAVATTSAVTTAAVAGSGTVVTTAGNTGFNAGCWVITCPLVLAIGILYEATAQNSRNQNKALQELKSIMETGQSNMQNTALKMEQADLEITQLTKESETDKATTEEEIVKKQDLIRTAQAAFEAIVARYKAGESLSSTDEEKLNACEAQIAALQGEIHTLHQASIDFSTANANTIESKKSEFDTHALNIAKEKGFTDYAASFDKQTRDGAIVQAVAQGLNVASGTYAAVEAGIFAASGSWLFGATAWAWAWMAMAIAGAGMSAHGVVEQSIIASDVNKEINVREDTEVMIDDSMDNYENKLRNVIAQGDFVNVGLAELSEFEQETITLENPFGDNQDNQDDKKKNNNLFT